jgi:hypothetical protein
MNLPNLYLADPAPATALTPALVQESCFNLRRNAERDLSRRRTADLINLLAKLGETWRDPGYRLLRLALDQGPEQTGFSRPIIEAGLRAFFRELTVEQLTRLIEQDLGDPARLDHWCATSVEASAGKRAVGTGPVLMAHIGAGALPNSIFHSLVLGLLCRSAQFVKCASGHAFLPRLLAHSIHELDRKLGACIEIAEWKGGKADLESELFQHADLVTVNGSDDAVSAVRRHLPAGKRFLGYGHRVSFGYISARAGAETGEALAAAFARDVAAWDQLGCLSPQVIYVQNRSGIGPVAFADLLAKELDALERTHPRGRLGVHDAATIASRRSFYEVRAAHSADTRMWCSAGSTAWTVVYEAETLFQGTCGNRFVYVLGAPDLTAALHGADRVVGNVSCVGLGAVEEERDALALELARWGVSRICSPGKMQSPPLTWRHDGQPSLAQLIQWTDLEA